uniref:SIS domain-containing protein n=1 Tax=Ignisphaera aggregans TaxID=334771 RepID=A0A7J2U2D9_9CREN
MRICCEKTLRDILEISTSIESVGKSFDVIKGVAEAIVGRGCRYFYFTGCGSSYYSAMLASFPLLVEGIDVGVYVLPSSEILMYYSSRLSRECCLVAISRSGETAETLDVLKIGRERGVYSIVITISERSRARDYVDSYLYIDVGAERGVVMTKSFFSMTLAGLMLTRSIVGMISGKIYDIISQLPILKEYVENVVNGREKIFSLARSYVEKGVKRFVFLGSGPAYPIALEGSLKLKESTYIATEALHALEFRHGPIATVGENQVIVVLNQDGESYNYVYKLYKELLSMGSYVLRLSSRDVDENTIPIAKTDFEELNVLSAIVPLQLFAYGYASALGLDIDNPRNLVKVVKQY